MSRVVKFAVLLMLLFCLLAATFYGAENSFVLLNFRLPRIIAAVLGGAALSVSGLTMQGVFKNPLAGPFVLGVSSGASLGVAIVSMTSVGILLGAFGILPAAALGAFAAIFTVFACSKFVKTSVGLLIVGLMIGYLADAVVTLLVALSDAETLRGFMVWGMGSFSRLTLEQIPVYAIAIAVGILPLLFSIRYLNLAPLGEEFVREHGVNEKFHRRVSLLSSSFLAATVTAFCGPIAFLGLAVPHLAFGIFKTTNNRILFPACMLIGADIALAASLVAILPLQSLMSIIGAPVVLWVLLKSGNSKKELN